MISVIGSSFLSLALFFNFYSIFGMFYYICYQKIKFRTSSIKSLYISSALIILSVFILVRELIQSNFKIEYVSKYSSLETPLIYKITGLWAGMEGSLLFWVAILSIYSSIVIFINNKKHQVLIPWIVIILMIIQSFFLILCTFFEDPFLPTTNISNNSSGLNPLLQHPLMIIHPPLLYLGYIGFSIPYAFALSALINKRMDTDWIRTTHRWTLFPWGCLSIAIILGGRWAYLELGWGGYWAWDPVENASLFPWLTGTAYLHSILIQEKKNMLKGWNVMLIMLTFTLTIFGTYLTRSGIISSIHAFAATDLGVWFFGFIIFIVVSNITILYMKKNMLVSQNKLESLISRESGFLYNNVIFISICLTILWGTLYPLISEYFNGVQIILGPAYFNKVILPFGIVLLLLTGIGPLLGWRKTSIKSLKKNFILPSIISITLSIIWASVYNITLIYPIIFSILINFVFTVIIMEFYRAITARKKIHNENSFFAFTMLFKKNRTRYGGYIVHLGIIIMVAGFIGKAFDKHADISMNINEEINLKNYQIKYKNYWMEDSNLNNRSNHIAKIISIDINKNGVFFTNLKPEKRFYIDQNNQPHSEVALKSTLFEDFYVVLGDVDMNSGLATIKVKINPMVSWVWIGSIFLFIGIVICLNPKLLISKK